MVLFRLPRQVPRGLRRWWELKRSYGQHLLAAGQTRDSVENATYALSTFERFCTERQASPLSASQSVIAEYIDWLQRTRSRATLRNRLVHLKLFFAYLVREGIVPDNPLSEVKPPRVWPAPIRPYSQRDLEKLFAALRRPREYALFFLYLGSGLRASEILRLRVEDFDFIRGLIAVDVKGGKRLVSSPGNRAVDALRFYMAAERIESGWLFPGRNGNHLTRNTLYCWIRTLAKRSGVPAANIHRFRHTFGHEFLGAGGNVGDLQLLFGHSKLETTLRYVAYGAVSRALEAQRRLNPADRLNTSSS